MTNSIVVFAPPGSGSGFKTLTVTNYVGSGANITMNAALGGSNSAFGPDHRQWRQGDRLDPPDDQQRRRPRRSDLRRRHPARRRDQRRHGRARRVRARQHAAGRRIQVYARGVQQRLVSRLHAGPDARPGSELDQQVAKAQQTQIVTNRVLNSILLGATQQISCSSCAGGFASIGSFAAGAQGRWGLSDELTLIGGFSYNQWYASGISVENAPTVAGSLVYDFWKWGESRPFFEVGGALTPYEDVHYTRYYANGLTTAVGNASAIDRDLSLFARAGWIDRLSPIDEAAVYGDLEPELDADRRLHRDDQLPQPLPRHGEQRPRHAERRAPRRAMDASLQRQYRGQRQRGGRLRVRGRRQRCNERLTTSARSRRARLPNTTWME